MPWSGVFTSWCSDHQLDPVNCPVGALLEFLQERLTAGLSPVHFKGLYGGHKCLPHSFGWNFIGERSPGISFPPWCFEAEVLQAFCPPPFQNADQERHNLLCPVQALDAYVHRAALWHKNEQLFVCFGPLASPRGLWCGRLVLTTHIHQILFFGPGLYPRVPSALVLVLLVRFHTGQALVAMVVLY